MVEYLENDNIDIAKKAWGILNKRVKKSLNNIKNWNKWSILLVISIKTIKDNKYV